MQHDIRQPGDARETGRAVKIGKDGRRPRLTPPGALGRFAQQGENPVVSDQTRQSAARHVAATDNQ